MWLKYVPGVSFRTDNEPFKVHFYCIDSFITFFTFVESNCFEFVGGVNDENRRRCNSSCRKLSV